MKAKRHLDKLLNDFVDLDQDNYFLIKENLERGITYSMPAEHFLQWDMPPRQDKINLTALISRLQIRVVTAPSLANLRGSYAIHLMENENFEINITCSTGKQLGIKTLNFEKLKQSSVAPSYLNLSKWFLYNLSQSSTVEIFLRVPTFSSERLEWEKNNFIGNTRGYVEKLKEDSDWGQKNMNHLLEETGWAIERLKLFGKQWPSENPMLVRELMDLNLIHFTKVLDWHYFLTNFWHYTVTNEKLLNPPNDYEQDYQKFLNRLNIKEQANVES